MEEGPEPGPLSLFFHVQTIYPSISLVLGLCPRMFFNRGAKAQLASFSFFCFLSSLLLGFRMSGVRGHGFLPYISISFLVFYCFLVIRGSKGEGGYREQLRKELKQVS